MVILVALLLGTVKPPAAYAAPGHLRLAISSWCWGTHCGAPIAASGRPIVVHRGGLVTVAFAATPTKVRVAVSGAPVTVVTSGSTISWRPKRMGGMTINVTYRRGFAAYVGRLVIKP
jgi:hypothetical protein